MSKLYLIITFLCFNIVSQAQDLKFESRVDLFNHPVTNDGSNRFGYGYPYLPLDYNNDGKTDFIGATFSKQFLYKGLTDLEFQQIDIYQGFAHNPIKVVDFDKDGKSDVVMERYINRYIAEDSFHFYYSSDIEDPIYEVEDFNKDGKTDLLAFKNNVFGADIMKIYYNDGFTKYRSDDIYNDIEAEAIKIVDIDLDGDKDIFVTYFLEDAYGAFLINDGNANFSLKELFINEDLNFGDLEFADFNGDGKPDLLALGYENNIYVFDNASILGNDIISNYDYRINTQGKVVTFHYVDLNNDNDNDFVLWLEINDKFEIRVLEGTTGNNFKTTDFIGEIAPVPSFYGLQTGINLRNNLSVYDYNNDGRKDILITDGFSAIPKIALFTNISNNTKVTDYSSNDYSINPNPVTNNINLVYSNTSKAQKYKIIKTTGSVVISGAMNQNEANIDVNFLEKGIYFLEITDIAGKKEIKKFIKL